MFLYAQDAENGDEEEEEDVIINIESDWSRAANLYTSGDQVFCINLGLVIPLFFVEQEAGKLDNAMNLGGMGALAYNYFLGPNWYLGGELCGMFASTEGGNMFYIIPIGFRVGYQFILSRFEFPLSIMVGIAPQSYNQRTYLGFFAKPAVGVFFRYKTEWSFGLNTSFWWAPEWTNKTRELDYKSSTINVHGFFLEISLGVRYHF